MRDKFNAERILVKSKLKITLIFSLSNTKLLLFEFLLTELIIALNKSIKNKLLLIKSKLS